MKVIQHDYFRCPNVKWQCKVDITELTGPLANAVELKAAENPDHVIVGTAINDEVKCVEVIPEL